MKHSFKTHDQRKIMKICFIFSNRSEYGELEPFIDYFKKTIKVDCIDLSKKIKNIEDNKTGIKIYQICLKQFISKNYDYVCILGDRKELPHVAFAAFYTNTKIIHFAAGEYIKSATTVDQYVRPIITILSTIQICFSKEAVKNVQKLFGGIPYLKDNAYFSGNPIFRGIDLNKIFQKNKERYDLVLLHPQSLSKKKTLEDINKLKKQLSNKKTIFLYGNKDQNYQIIEKYYKKLKAKKNSYIFYKTLPKEEYFGLVKYCDNFYTNTSSIYEIKHINKKSLKIIGDRNRDRNIEIFNDKAPEYVLKIIKNQK
jgi:UDP-N-acetylglucosamine 2-epimerase